MSIRDSLRTVRVFDEPEIAVARASTPPPEPTAERRFWSKVAVVEYPDLDTDNFVVPNVACAEDEYLDISFDLLVRAPNMPDGSNVRLSAMVMLSEGDPSAPDASVDYAVGDPNNVLGAEGFGGWFNFETQGDDDSFPRLQVTGSAIVIDPRQHIEGSTWWWSGAEDEFPPLFNVHVWLSDYLISDSTALFYCRITVRAVPLVDACPTLFNDDYEEYAAESYPACYSAAPGASDLFFSPQASSFYDIATPDILPNTAPWDNDETGSGAWIDGQFYAGGLDNDLGDDKIFWARYTPDTDTWETLANPAVVRNGSDWDVTATPMPHLVRSGMRFGKMSYGTLASQVYPADVAGWNVIYGTSTDGENWTIGELASSIEAWLAAEHPTWGGFIMSDGGWGYIRLSAGNYLAYTEFWVTDDTETDRFFRLAKTVSGETFTEGWPLGDFNPMNPLAYHEDANVVIAWGVFDGSIWYSTDDGLTWSDSGETYNGSINCYAYIPTNFTLLLWDDTDVHIFNGATWTSEAATHIPASDVEVRGDGAAWAEQHGMLMSPDSFTGDWATSVDGLEWVPVDMSISGLAGVGE